MTLLLAHPENRRMHAPRRTPRGLLATAFALLSLAAPAARAVSFHSTAIDLTPDGEEVWVVNPDHGTVSVIKTRQPDPNTLLAEIPVGNGPWCLDIHPTNGEIWVACQGDDRIVIVDGPGRTVIGSFDAGFETFGVAFSPQGDVALVTATGSDEIFVVDVATRAILETMPVYRRPRGIAWREDGARAWVSHLLQPEYFGRLTVVEPAAGTTHEIQLLQVFGSQRGGYAACMQNIALGPAPADSLLWMPTHLVNSAKGGLSGIPLTPTNSYHAVLKAVNVTTEADLNWDTYFLSEGGSPNTGYAGGTTPVGGPIAVDFRDYRAFVANLQSNDVTVLTNDLLHPAELATFPAGDAPIGIVTHPDIHRVYVANWLSRDVTVFNPSAMVPVATVATTTSEVLTEDILRGKRLFFTSTGRMSFEHRGSCSSCHPFGRSDGHTWDFSQFGSHVRSTPDWRTIGQTGPLGWTANVDEVQDFEWSIRNLLGGAGLIDGTPNPPLGPRNGGLSGDLDALARFVTTSRHRSDTPYLQPDRTLTAEADSGRVLFHDSVVGCASCHVPPFYTDSSLLASPFIRHDVGTADSTDAEGAGGFDTPSLVGVWDTGPWLHRHQAKTLEAVLTTFNPDDEHGITSHLAPDQIGFLVAFLRSIGWPDSAGSPVAAGDLPALRTGALDPAFPNPFSEATSLRFRVEAARADVLIDIVDVAGRRVRTVLSRELPHGTHVVGWDGADQEGGAVAPGIYFARLRLDGRSAGAKRLTILR
jgi:YVTN family beta-propeller protein